MANREGIEAEVDQVLDQLIETHGLVGAAVGVMQRGTPLILKGYGLADLEHKAPVTPKTLFQSASIGKMFTTTALMLLSQRGMVSLEDTLDQYFENVPEFWGRITLRQLMSNTSGLSEYFRHIDLQRDYDEDALLEIIRHLPEEFPPGSRYAYCNTNFLLLGFIIGRVTDGSRDRFLKQDVFRPAGMQTAQVNEVSRIVPRRASGYILEDGELQKAFWVSPSLSRGADGGLLLSLLDMAAWDSALYTDIVLPRAVLESMWEAPALADGTRPWVNYGFGWRTDSIRGNRLVNHRGTFQGFNLKFLRFVDAGTSIIVMTNHGTQAEHLAKRIAGAVNPDFAPYTEIPDSDPGQTLGTHAALVKYLRGQWDETMFAAGSEQWLRGSRQARATSLLDFRLGGESSLTLVDERQLEDTTLRSYRVHPAIEPEWIVHVYSRQGERIHDLAFQYDY